MTALVFDVFGTVVDWRGSIIREGEHFSRTTGIVADWPRFADAWRHGYAPTLARINRAELPWMNLDAVHGMILDDVLAELDISLNAEQRDHLNRVWHRLQPWPDAVASLHRLRARYLIAPLSNGHFALLTNMAKRAGLPWDCILSAELAGRYKPDPAVYKMAARLLDLPAHEIMMVAAHADDLRAARTLGFRTAFVHRPFEWGDEATRRETSDAAFDVVAQDFADLATQLGGTG